VYIFVGYPDNHYHDTYRLLNFKTKKIIESRDVIWTGKMYGTYKKKENEEESYEEREEDFGLSMATLFDPLKPRLFKSAWYHKVKYERDGWRKAIQQELNNMEKRDVWEVINKYEIPKDRKIIGCQWVFKKKRSGIH
jgi:hypothetical protein